MGERMVLLDDGKLNLAELERALADAALQIEGICSTGLALTRRYGFGGWPQVNAWVDTQGRIHVKLRLAARFGHDLAALSQQAQDTLARCAETWTQREIAPIDVRVRRVVV